MVRTTTGVTQGSGAVFESAGAPRVAGFVKCAGYDGNGADGQREQEGDSLRVDPQGSGWLEQTGDHVQQIGNAGCQADQRGPQDGHHEGTHDPDGYLPAGGPPLERQQEQHDPAQRPCLGYERPDAEPAEAVEPDHQDEADQDRDGRLPANQHGGEDEQPEQLHARPSTVQRGRARLVGAGQHGRPAPISAW